jgi:uncharacterized protein YukE
MSGASPAWTPRWDDVRFDQAAASAAADASRRVADLLERVGHASLDAAGAAQVDWSGRAREEFDGAHTRWLQRCATEAEALRRSAAHLEAAADEARLQQTARERERARWHQERRELQARASTEAG